MSSSIRPPRVASEMSKTKHRVHDLERRIAKKPLTPADIPGYIAKFSLNGPITASTSGCEVHPRGARLVLLYATLVTAGTTRTVLQPLKNGQAYMSQLVLLPGITYNEAIYDDDFSARKDTLQIEVVEAGADASMLSVFGKYDN